LQEAYEKLETDVKEPTKLSDDNEKLRGELDELRREKERLTSELDKVKKEKTAEVEAIKKQATRAMTAAVCHHPLDARLLVQCRLAVHAGGKSVGTVS
jgi:predicted  nucleic acid-binding Zn-ribbon protein